MKRKYALLLLILAPLILMGIGPFLASGPGISTTSTPSLGAELVTNNCVNAVVNPYDTFDGVSPTGFHCVSDGTGAANGGTPDELPLVSGVLYRLGYAFAKTSGVNPASYASQSSGGASAGFGPGTTNVGQNNFNFLSSATATSLIEFYLANGSATNSTFSGLTIRPTTLSSLLAPTRPFSGSGTFRVTTTSINCAAGEWLGGWLYANASNPANVTRGVLFLANRTNGNAELRIVTAVSAAGAITSTSLINSAFTFTSGQQVRFDYNKATKVGALYYNNVQIGANQDLTAYSSWIDQSRYHFLFSTTAVTPGSVVYSYTQQ